MWRLSELWREYVLARASSAAEVAQEDTRGGGSGDDSLI